ncbi:hypothetical protein ACFL25_01210, partial [Patescibacteria group bacterium]
PISYLGEQQKNAQFSKKYAGSCVISQKVLTPAKLKKEISNISANWNKISNNLITVDNPDKKASKNIVDLMKKYVK